MSVGGRLILHTKEIHSVFELLGKNENDISFSVAWALSKCPFFLTGFLTAALGFSPKSGSIEIRLQRHEKDHGYTDIEIECENEFYIIVEAKRGWVVPGEQQLRRYASRASFEKSKAKTKRLIVLSECSRDYGARRLCLDSVCGVSVEFISWRDIARIALVARKRGAHAHKRLLDELLIYLKGLMTMQKIDSNLVYVVAVSADKPKNWQISWIDVIEKKRRYFHPMGIKGWPKEPPNYIGFRYRGHLQSIHHIEGFEIVDDLHQKIREIPSHRHPALFLYRLGPGIRPTRRLSSKGIWPNGRVWCMLDTLLTSDTIAEARNVTQTRLKKV